MVLKQLNKISVKIKDLTAILVRGTNKPTPHGVDVYPQSAAGVPFTAAYIAAKGDPIANLQEDLAAEQKARATYEKLIDLCKDDPDVIDPLRFLRQREVVHFQRFGEALRGVQDKLAEKKFYMTKMNCNQNNCGCNMNNNCDCN
ncbi:MAG: manganese catalase family protein [Clostridia bacterium]|nr:manganese catalase family protein [Clostridia bacterium]